MREMPLHMREAHTQDMFCLCALHSMRAMLLTPLLLTSTRPFSAPPATSPIRYTLVPRSLAVPHPPSPFSLSHLHSSLLNTSCHFSHQLSSPSFPGSPSPPLPVLSFSPPLVPSQHLLPLLPPALVPRSLAVPHPPSPFSLSHLHSSLLNTSCHFSHQLSSPSSLVPRSLAVPHPPPFSLSHLTRPSSTPPATSPTISRAWHSPTLSLTPTLTPSLTSIHPASTPPATSPTSSRPQRSAHSSPRLKGELGKGGGREGERKGKGRGREGTTRERGYDFENLS
ncbi:unnamed protein product [Closterium sp. Naga37s-1]|nr:unnamed protein product [Closterium sp. Naga37s-1]